MLTPGASSYSQSALRYGLVDIKPVEIVETIKRFGIKFRRVTHTFESLRPSESYEDMVTFDNELVFHTIDLPERFDQEKLVKLYSHRSIENYKKDIEFKEAVEKCKKADRIGRPLLSLVQLFKSRFESAREYFLSCEAEKFLKSNFPLDFYNNFVVFDNTYYDFLKILEDTVRRSEFYATYARSFDMYKRHIDDMKKRLRPILDRVDTCFFSNLCLDRYVDIWNAKDYEQIFAPKYLDIKNVDYTQLEQLTSDFKTRLTEIRKFFLSFDPQYLHKQQLDFEDPTVKMFSRVVMLPSEALRAERQSA